MSGIHLETLAVGADGTKYQKTDQISHILLRPATYIGTVNLVTEELPVYDLKENTIEYKSVEYVPGLLKIFDEILVNASDNKQRDDKTSFLKVTIKSDHVSIMNDGRSIIFDNNLPEVLFGHLLTGSNFAKDKVDTTGGQNGYGSKLTNIYSKRFEVDIVNNKRKYRQVWTDNMRKCGDPKITAASTSDDYVKVTFYPDFSRFPIDKITDDMFGLMARRAADIAGTTGLKVYVNNKRIRINNFSQYTKLYTGRVQTKEFVCDRWHVIVAAVDNPNSRHMSFVNHIATTRGGQHLRYCVLRIVSAMKAKETAIKDLPYVTFEQHMMLFVNCLISNPKFDTQTKVCLMSKPKQWGSYPKFTKKFTDSVCGLGITKELSKVAKFKENLKAARKTDGKRQSTIRGIPKLDDANKAGTRQGHKCTLILTEGDSAKALAVAGLSVVGRDFYGVFPLKGKPINVQGKRESVVSKNQIFSNLKQILGLREKEEYKDAKSLRYGHVMIMADQDHDGSHIKGLVINMFKHCWPSLFKMPGFLQEFITPIVKCTKGKEVRSFFTVPEYEQWIAQNPGWRVKYYKGLGTSTNAEAKHYFTNLDRHTINFVHKDGCDEKIDLVFGSKNADKRKKWIVDKPLGVFLDQNVQEVGFDEFVDKELILYSEASVRRAIPSFIDGLKPSQRKILWASLKRNLRSEIKVAQLAGYVSEHAAYHHGEASLAAAIIGLARVMIGGPQYPPLVNSGQFGTREEGGKNAASPRYIFTYLCSYVRDMYPDMDDAVLKYVDDDGTKVEPYFYVGSLPWVLLNANSGVATGWSSDIPRYKLEDVCDRVRQHMRGMPMPPLHPHYLGFKGTIEPNGQNYVCKGSIEDFGDELHIRELPIGVWTSNYKAYLEKMRDADKPLIKGFEENHVDDNIFFKVYVDSDQSYKLNDMGLHKAFHLQTNINTTNMMFLDENDKVVHFQDVRDIIKAWVAIRRKYMDLARSARLAKLKHEALIADNKCKFIADMISGALVLKNASVDQVRERMQKYYKDPTDALQEKPKGVHHYLLCMSFKSITKKAYEELKKKAAAKIAEYETLRKMTVDQLIFDVIDECERVLKQVNKKRTVSTSASGKKRGRK